MVVPCHAFYRPSSSPCNGIHPSHWTLHNRQSDQPWKFHKSAFDWPLSSPGPDGSATAWDRNRAASIQHIKTLTYLCSRVSHILTVYWLDFYSGATLTIQTVESCRIIQHHKNRVTWMYKNERRCAASSAHRKSLLEFTAKEDPMGQPELAAATMRQTTCPLAFVKITRRPLSDTMTPLYAGVPASLVEVLAITVICHFSLSKNKQ